MSTSHQVIATEQAAQALGDVAEELSQATGKFDSFASPHEGYAVILEELDELWDEVKANNVEASIDEAIQVAAMATRYVMDMRDHSGQR
jgi:hypothetical protein